MSAPRKGAIQTWTLKRGAILRATVALATLLPGVGGGQVFALSSTGAALTSAAGASPEVNLTFGSDIFPGFYLRIQRSTNGAKDASGNYTTKTLDIIHAVTETERQALAIPNTNLAADGYSSPSGAYWQRYRWEREDGATGPWSEVSGTVTVSVAALNTVTGVNKNQYNTVSGAAALTFTGTDTVGSFQPVRATVQAQGALTQMEATINAVKAGSYFAVGYANTVDNFNSAFVAPGYNNGNGISVHISTDGVVRALWNGGGNSFTFANAAGTSAVGDTFTFRLNKTAGTLDVWRTRSGTTTKIGGQATGLPTGLASYYAYGAPQNNESVTFNFGATAFAKALDNGYSYYG